MKRSLLRALLAAQEAKRPVALLTEVESGRQLLIAGADQQGDLAASASLIEAVHERLQQERSGLLEDGKYFLQVFLPPLRLIIVGAVHISQALVPMAKLAGYEVSVIDPRKAWATEARFPGTSMLTQWPDEAMEALQPDARTAVVTLTHDPKLDDPALLRALNSPAFYVGALGSTRTHARRLERLRAEGLDEAALARIHGPAGLAIGARAPAEIAISVMAQMTAVLRQAPRLAPLRNP